MVVATAYRHRVTLEVLRLNASEYKPFHGICFEGNDPYTRVLIRLFGWLAFRVHFRRLAVSGPRFVYTQSLATELGMRPLLAHCHRGLGTLYAATGQREQARTALTTAMALYRAMEMTFWLPQAEATLAQVT